MELEVCLWCGYEIEPEAHYRVYCKNGETMDYCSRDHAELDSSAGPVFRGSKIRKVPFRKTRGGSDARPVRRSAA